MQSFTFNNPGNGLLSQQQVPNSLLGQRLIHANSWPLLCASPVSAFNFQHSSSHVLLVNQIQSAAHLDSGFIQTCPRQFPNSNSNQIQSAAHLDSGFIQTCPRQFPNSNSDHKQSMPPNLKLCKENSEYAPSFAHDDLRRKYCLLRLSRNSEPIPAMNQEFNGLVGHHIPERTLRHWWSKRTRFLSANELSRKSMADPTDQWTSSTPRPPMNAEGHGIQTVTRKRMFGDDTVKREYCLFRLLRKTDARGSVSAIDREFLQIIKRPISIRSLQEYWKNKESYLTPEELASARDAICHSSVPVNIEAEPLQLDSVDPLLHCAIAADTSGEVEGHSTGELPTYMIKSTVTGSTGLDTEAFIAASVIEAATAAPVCEQSVAGCSVRVGVTIAVQAVGHFMGAGTLLSLLSAGLFVPSLENIAKPACISLQPVYLLWFASLSRDFRSNQYLQDIINKSREVLQYKLERAYRLFKRVTGGGAEAGVSGLSGTFSPCTMVKILGSLLRTTPNGGLRLCDLGCGPGHVLIAAAVAGAEISFGIDLLENAYVFHTIFSAVNARVQSCAQIAFGDIDALSTLPNKPSCVFSFWEGIPYESRRHLIALVANTSTVSHLVVTTARQESKQKVLSELQDLSPYGLNQWEVSETIEGSMYASSCIRQVWIFQRSVGSSAAAAAVDTSQNKVRKIQAQRMDFGSDLLISMFNSKRPEFIKLVRYMFKEKRDGNIAAPSQNKLSIGMDQQQLFQLGAALLGQNVTNMAVIAAGGNGLVISAEAQQRKVVIKVTVKSGEEVMSCDDAILRELDAIARARSVLSKQHLDAVSELMYIFDNGTTPAAFMTLGNAKFTAVALGWCPCDSRVVLDEFIEDWRKGIIQDRFREFFFTLSRILDAVHAVSMAHCDLKYDNLLLAKPWPPGARLHLVIADWGGAVVGAARRQYVLGTSSIRPKETNPSIEPEQSVRRETRTVTRRGQMVYQKHQPRADMTAPSSLQQQLRPSGPLSETPKVVGVTFDMLKRIMWTQEPKEHVLAFITKATTGYRDPHQLKEPGADCLPIKFPVCVKTNRQIDGSEGTKALYSARLGDVFSVGAMIARPFYNMFDSKGKRTNDAQSWVVALSKLNSAEAVREKLLDGKETVQDSAIKAISHIIYNMLNHERHLRYSAERAAKDTALQNVFLSQREEQYVSEGGLSIHGGEAPEYWKKKHQITKQKQVMPHLLIKRVSPKIGLGVFVGPGRKVHAHDLVQFYSGEVTEERDTFSIYTLPLANRGQHMVGRYSSEWPLSRFIAERSAAHLINSSSTSKTVRAPSKINVYYDVRLAVHDTNGALKVPFFASRDLEEGEQLFYDYSSGFEGNFKIDDSDTDE